MSIHITRLMSQQKLGSRNSNVLLFLCVFATNLENQVIKSSVTGEKKNHLRQITALENADMYGSRFNESKRVRGQRVEGGKERQ